MKKITHVLSISAALMSTVLVSAQSTPRNALLALSKSDHTLAIVDPTTLKVIAKAPVGSDPHEVVASADGKTAYVTIYGGGSLHELDVMFAPHRFPVAAQHGAEVRNPGGRVSWWESHLTALQQVGYCDLVSLWSYIPQVLPTLQKVSLEVD